MGNNGTAASLCTVAAIACAPATASVGTMVAIGAAAGAVGSVAGNEVQAVSEVIEKDVFGKQVETEGLDKFGNPTQLLTEAAIGGATGGLAGGCAVASAGNTGGLVKGATVGKDGTVTVARLGHTTARP